MNPTEILETLRNKKKDEENDVTTRAAHGSQFLVKVAQGLKQIQPNMKFRRKRILGSVTEPFMLYEQPNELYVKFGNFSITCGFSRGSFMIWPDQALLAMDSLFMGEIGYHLSRTHFASQAVELILKILVKYEVEE